MGTNAHIGEDEFAAMEIAMEEQEESMASEEGISMS